MASGYALRRVVSIPAVLVVNQLQVCPFTRAQYLDCRHHRQTSQGYDRNLSLTITLRDSALPTHQTKDNQVTLTVTP